LILAFIPNLSETPSYLFENLKGEEKNFQKEEKESQIPPIKKRQ